MAILPVPMPPGFYRNGTPYTRKTRVEDGNLVRFYDGAWRPVGGWSVLLDNVVPDPATEIIRDIYAFKGTTKVFACLQFSSSSVYYIDNTAASTDITPVGHVPLNGTNETISLSGYGVGGYGLGGYGVTDRFGEEATLTPDRWYFDTYGDGAVFGCINNGPLYEFGIVGGTVTELTNAPTNNQDVVVTNERQVFVVGANGESRRIRASEVEQANEWAVTDQNQAIDRTLPGSGNLLRALRVGGDVLIIGRDDAHLATYVGPPLVYRTRQLSVNCGPIAKRSMISVTDLAVWWGPRNFWIYQGGTVNRLDCEVMDFLIKDIDPLHYEKINCFSNSLYSEVWWVYQSLSSTDDVDSYVAWNHKTGEWYTGKLTRTCGVDREPFEFPVMVGVDGNLYQHEQLDLFPSVGEVFVQTGPIDIANGEVNTAIQQIYPDHDGLDGVTYEIKARQFPRDTEYTYGPYTARNPTSTRALGREVKLKVALTGVDNKAGALRLEIANRGTGRR